MSFIRVYESQRSTFKRHKILVIQVHVVLFYAIKLIRMKFKELCEVEWYLVKLRF